MHLHARYVLSTTTQSIARWIAWLALSLSLPSTYATLPDNPSGTSALHVFAFLTLGAASIFLARSRAPAKGDIRTDEQEIAFDNEKISRLEIAGGYWSPGSGRRGSGIVLLGRDERELAWIGVGNHAEGDRWLEHLGIGPRKRTVQFDAATATVRPAFIRVGVDGVSFGTRTDARFIPWTDVKRVEKSTRGAELELANGSRFELPLALRRLRGEQARQTQTALVSVARDALEASKRDAVPDVSVQIARNGRSHDEWIKALVNRDGSFREAPLRSEDLWRVVESPTAETSARAGAAAVLAQEATAEDRARLRVAAETCAEPKLRVVLDKAATGEEVLEALEDVEATTCRAAR